jgi:alpha-beta hydrolase superfamily lysophospholipase
MNQIINKNIYHDFIKTYKTYKFIYPDKTEISLNYKKKKNNKKTILWIPGFNDYYYHFFIGEKFLKEGYDIYAITLRRYEENNLTPFYTNDLSEYIKDINNLLPYILKEKYEKILFYGHSTGALVSILYCNEGLYKKKINGLILNSPFFEFNLDIISLLYIKYIVYYLAYYFPTFLLRKYDEKVKNSLTSEIIKRFYINPNKKFTCLPQVYFGWTRTIILNQTKIQKGEVKLKIPILILHSNNSIYPSINKTTENGDDTLNIDDIIKYSTYIGNNVKRISIENAIHDVFCSTEIPRNIAIDKMFDWLNKTIV